MMRQSTLRNVEVQSRAVDDFVCGVGEFDQQLVGSRGKAGDDDWFAAGVEPVPGGVVEGEVEVAHPRGNVQGGRAVHGEDSEVLGAVSDNRAAHWQLVGEGGIDDEAGWWLGGGRDDGGGGETVEAADGAEEDEKDAEF